MTAEPIAPEPVRGITVQQYDLLVEAGLLEGWPVELLGGFLAEMTPQGAPHYRVIRRLTVLLAHAIDPAVLELGAQGPMQATDIDEPEPDLAVFPLTEGHPIGGLLVVEVAVTSQRRDLVLKPAVYSAAGVPDYWVIDVPGRRVVVHRDPDAGRYATITTHRPPERLRPLHLDVTVDLASLLP